MNKKPVGWRRESARHAAAARGVETRPRRKGMFARGNPQRAVRDVLARKLEDEPGITNPYALATDIVKRGVKLGPGDKSELVAELLEQYHMDGIKLTKARAEWIAEKWVRKDPFERIAPILEGA